MQLLQHCRPVERFRINNSQQIKADNHSQFSLCPVQWNWKGTNTLGMDGVHTSACNYETWGYFQRFKWGKLPV